MTNLGQTILDATKDKYFVHSEDPERVVVFKEPFEFFWGMSEMFMSAWNPLEETKTSVGVGELEKYNLISEEEFEAKKKGYVSGHARAVAKSGPID